MVILNLLLITTIVALFINFAGFMSNAFKLNGMEDNEHASGMKQVLVKKTLLTWGVTILILSCMLGILLYIKYFVL